MILYSSLFVILVGIAFQLLGILLARIIFNVPVSDLTNLEGDIDKKVIAAVKFLQIIGALGTFVFSSFLISFLYTGSWTGYFLFEKNLNIAAVLLLILIMIAALPLVNFLTELNLNFKIPFDGIERYFREMEENVQSLMMTLIKADNVGALLVNLFMIAIIPAVGEELVFRGLIQRHLSDLFKNAHVAIILASIVFSLAHFQIYSFLPRFFLGLILGYAYYYGRSLWYPMIAHLVNNTMGVMFYYLSSLKEEVADKTGTIEDIGTTELLPVLAFGSIVLVAFLFFVWVKTLQSSRDVQAGQP